MSIKPPSDLLLDVARAADPTVSAAAAERLAKMASAGGKTDPAFSQVLDEVGPPPPVPVKAEAALAEPTGPRFAPAPPKDANEKAYQGLEALLLQNVVETMLPESSEIFGEGSAGAIWRSMMAEQLGKDLAKKIDLGIAPKYLHLGRKGKAAAHGETGEARLQMSAPVIPKQS